MADRDDFKPFTQLLANWDQNAQDILTQLQQLTSQWLQICGSPLASHCRPLWIRNHQLSIEADSALWANRVHHTRLALLDSLRELGFDTIHGVEAKVRPGTVTRQSVSSRNPVSTHIIKDMRSVARTVANPALRHALMRLAQAAERK